MFMRAGNVSPDRFAELVQAEFTAEELEYLRSVHSGYVTLRDDEDFHIYDDPALQIHFGSQDSKAVKVFCAAHGRKPFKVEVALFIDDRRK